MAHTSYDPRKGIREIIGTLHAVKKGSWDEQYCISVYDNHGNKKWIPMYLAEEVKSLDEPSMPFIDMKIMLVEYTPHDVGALTRRHKAYLDVGVWFTNTDNIDSTEFGKKIVDKLQNLIRTTQENCGFHSANIDFININTVKYRDESKGRQVVYGYIIEVYCIYYD